LFFKICFLFLKPQPNSIDMKTFQPIFILVALIASACSVTIPEVDETPPRIIFSISGGGIDRTCETEEEFFETLTLQTGVIYHFNLSVSDPGGLRLVQWQIPGERSLNFLTPINEPWEIRNIGSLSRMIEWTGDVENPVNSAVLTGRFTKLEDGIGFDYRFFARDFGGTAGASNATSRTLMVLIP